MEHRELRPRLEALARSYVPQWRFDPDDPDVGSVAALLLEEMQADSERRFAQVLRAHKVRFLNLFDRMCTPGVQAARSYVQFEPVAGADETVYVPKGTLLLADDGQGGPALEFETAEGITASAARLTAIVAAQRAGDRIVTVLDDDEAERCTFTAFDPEPPSEAHHELELSFGRGLEELPPGPVGLKLSTADPADAPAAAQALAGGKVQFFARGPEGLCPLPAPQAEEDTLWFQWDSTLARQPGTALVARADGPLPVSVCGAHLVFSRQGLPPAEVRCGGIAQAPGRFYPFGSPLELYAECGIECPAALERPGARVTLSFSLSFETLEQALPQAESQVDYRVIMKKSAPAPQPQMRDVQPDYVLVEYLSADGWRRLLPDEHAALLFNGSAQGHISLSFACPADLASPEQAAGECRLRLRLLRAEGLYQLPLRQHIPVVEGLQFAFTYEDAPLAPESAWAVNNFQRRNVGSLWAAGRSAAPFTSAERRGACLYLGFDASPQGSPLSLYFQVENNEDLPLDYAVEYLSPGGFAPVQVQDGTEGLLYSGALLALVPADAARASLYGKERWWLRLVCGEDLAARPGLPVVHGIRTNMAPVENRSTATEEFYVDDPAAPARFQLARQDILQARVYVNEARPEAPGRDNWVLWTRRTHVSQQGRYYDLDAAAGAVLFGRHTFSVYAPPEGAAAVRVVYQSYRGARGNVPAGAINTMAQPIRYVASVSNPMAAYGGADGGGEADTARRVATLLRTRARAVSERDYFDIITQLGCGVRRIKCRSGVDRQGNPAPDTITVALLIDEYEKGSHIFSAVKQRVHDALTGAGGVVPLGKTLVLCQPRFVRYSVRIWLRCAALESVYEVQRRTEASIRRYLDPLCGGFDGRGWAIGQLPGAPGLLAYLKMKDAGLRVERMALVARAGGREYTVDDDFLARPMNGADPFVMAVNGPHTVYVELQ